MFWLIQSTVKHVTLLERALQALLDPPSWQILLKLILGFRDYLNPKPLNGMSKHPQLTGDAGGRSTGALYSFFCKHETKFVLTSVHIAMFGPQWVNKG